MNEDRLNEIEGWARQGRLTRSADVYELVAEVRRLRDGINGLADEADHPFSGRYTCDQSGLVHLITDLRALLADPGDSHTDNTTDRT
jgi:hypothetical protein